MTQSELYMTEGVCLGIAGLIIVIWGLVKVYGIRDSKRSTIQEANK